MIGALLLFLPSGNLGDWLMRGLAVVGAAALGGFGAGLILQIATRLTTTRQVPRPVLRLIRILGGITGGLLVAFALFHAGGPGGGGSGSGGGKDSGQGPYDTSAGKDTPLVKEKPKDSPPPSPRSMRVVVIPGTDGHCYRIDDQAVAHTFDEIKKIIAFRRALATPLEKVTIVIYADSPDQGTPIVRQLKTLVQDNQLTPVIEEQKGKIP
jgi:hypothetical protein